MSFANAPRCTHITVTGHRCGSPALRKEHFCYFHTRMIKGVACRVDMRIEPQALFESPDAIQAALMHVYSDILEGQINYRKASLLLKALQIATTLSRRVDFERAHYNMVTEVPSWNQQFLDEHPEYGPPLTEAEKAAMHASMNTVDPPKPPATSADAKVSEQKPATPAAREQAALSNQHSEITIQKSAVAPVSSEKPASAPPQPAIGNRQSSIDSSHPAISNQKSATPPPPQSEISNRQSKMSLSARQQAQWKDIDRVERALAGALKGDVKDMKTVFAFRSEEHT